MPDIKSVFRTGAGRTRTIRFPLGNSSVGKPKDRRSDTLSLRELALSEREGSPFRFYGTLQYISPLSGRASAPEYKSDLFMPSTDPISHKDRIKLNIGYIEGYDEVDLGRSGRRFSGSIPGSVRQGGLRREIIAIACPFSGLDFIKASFSTGPYGEQVWNFTAPDSVGSADRQWVAYLSTEALEEGSIRSGNIIDASGNTAIHSTDTIGFSVYPSDGREQQGTKVDVAYRYRNRMPLDMSEGLPFVNGYRYSYNYLAPTIFADVESDRAIGLYQPYRIEYIDRTDFRASNTESDRC